MLDVTTSKRMYGWFKQTRLRSKRNGCVVDINYSDILKLYVDYNYKCAYCLNNQATTPDHPFPVNDKAPCILANIVPCCDDCKIFKKRRNLIDFWKSGELKGDRCKQLLSEMLKRDGAVLLKAHIRTLYKESK